MAIAGLTEKQVAWLKVWSLIIGTGSAVTVTSYVGGAKLWVAILVGIGTGMSNLYHALAESPKDKETQP